MINVIRDIKINFKGGKRKSKHKKGSRLRYTDISKNSKKFKNFDTARRARKTKKGGFKYLIRVKDDKNCEVARSMRQHKSNLRNRIFESFLGKRVQSTQKKEKDGSDASLMASLARNLGLKKLKIDLKQKLTIFVRDKLPDDILDVVDSQNQFLDKDITANVSVTNDEGSDTRRVLGVKIQLFDPINYSFSIRIHKNRRLIDLKDLIRERLEVFSPACLYNLKSLEMYSGEELLTLNTRFAEIFDKQNKSGEKEKVVGTGGELDGNDFWVDIGVKFELNRIFSEIKSSIPTTSKIPKTRKYRISPNRVELFRM